MQRRVRPYGLHRSKPLFNGGIALPHLLGVRIVQGQGLLERKHMLGLVMPRQRLGDVLRAARTLGLPKSRQVDGVALARHDGADDR